MKLFKDLPSTEIPINAESLNQIKDKLLIVSDTEPTGDDREKIWIDNNAKTINVKNDSDAYEKIYDMNIAYTQHDGYVNDCNTMRESGSYFYSSDTLNIPSTNIEFAQWGVILTMACKDISYPWITQIAIGNFTNTNRVATRTSVDSGESWNEWVAIG